MSKFPPRSPHRLLECSSPPHPNARQTRLLESESPPSTQEPPPPPPKDDRPGDRWSKPPRRSSRAPLQTRDPRQPETLQAASHPTWDSTSICAPSRRRF